MAKPPPSRDRRLSPRNNVNNSPSPAALEGALRAFNYAASPRIDSSITMADPPPISLLDSDPVPELPEPGSIKDKIVKFSTNSTAPGANDRPRAAVGNVPDITRQKIPQLLAAEIALRSSPWPSGKTTGVDVHRVQSQRNEKASSRELPSPIPIRKAMVNHRLLDSSLDNQGLSPVNPSANRKPAPPRPSTTSLPPITKARPIPPVPRKPSPISSEPTSTGNFLDNQNRYDESLISPIPLRSKASSFTLSGERPPALPPRRAATVSTNDLREHQLVPTRTKSPVWPSSSSVASFYSQSQNPSSSSMLDNLSDMSKDGPSDAVAASSLASSRALQAKKSPPPPPPQRRHRSRSLLQLQHQSRKDQPPNPSTGSLRETLRTQPKSDDEDDYDRQHRRQHRNHIIHKHPHKHQEGDRRRWRSEVTEKDRKRYEGVWAANKGLLIPPSKVLAKQDTSGETPLDMYPPTAPDMVLNLVVQDIWSRSRLPSHVLGQIWDLVDGQKIGLLTRTEFVVGMWLIDQRLRGHKLPVVVSDSVWASVMRVPGISLDELRP